MIRVNARVVGAAELARNLRRHGDAVESKLQAALLEAGQAVASEAQRLVQDPPKSGRIYQKYTPRRTHQASAPGEAPATDLGDLVASIGLDETDVPAGRITIFASARHATFLELGTSRMAARPFLRRALETMKGRVLALFRAAMEA